MPKVEVKLGDVGMAVLGDLKIAENCLSDDSFESVLFLQAVREGRISLDLIRSLYLISEVNNESSRWC